MVKKRASAVSQRPKLLFMKKEFLKNLTASQQPTFILKQNLFT
nr:MAG TPA: hypothetical protein [Bacteriophage sp.]